MNISYKRWMKGLRLRFVLYETVISAKTKLRNIVLIKILGIYFCGMFKKEWSQVKRPLYFLPARCRLRGSSPSRWRRLASPGTRSAGWRSRGWSAAGGGWSSAWTRGDGSWSQLRGGDYHGHGNILQLNCAQTKRKLDMQNLNLIIQRKVQLFFFLLCP